MALPRYDELSDTDLVRAVTQRDAGAFRFLMTRCNQRLFRAARSVVASDHEAEDVVQEAYVQAYDKLSGFRGECALTTWLTQIVLNEARRRLRERKRTIDYTQLDAIRHGTGVLTFPARASANDEPMADASNAEIRRLLERAIDALPLAFRTVYVMRELEECSVEQTATLLGLRPETVKTRLHRARRMLRDCLEARVQSSLKDAFPFLDARCRHISDAVLMRLRLAAARAEDSPAR